MNWDTKETIQWIESETKYQWMLTEYIGNELLFMSALFMVISDINRQLQNENRINTKNVNGNEVYVEFSKVVENEQEGWK